MDDYLEGIRHYLGDRTDTEEILAEIRSHLLEKTQNDGGEVTDAALQDAIEEYGSPRQVAARYLEESHIIHPTYRQFLFRYTWLLFAIHYGLKILSFVFGDSFPIQPFGLDIHVTRWPDLFIQLPFTWIADFGLVALVFYLITQNPTDVRLAWPRFFRRSLKPVKMRGAEPWKLWAWITLLIVLLAAYFRNETLFFQTIDFKKPLTPLLQPDASQTLSLLVLALVGFEIITLLLRIRFRSLWVDFANTTVYMISFIFVLAIPREQLFLDSRLLFLADLAAWVIGFTLIILAYDLIRILRTVLTAKPFRTVEK